MAWQQRQARVGADGQCAARGTLREGQKGGPAPWSARVGPRARGARKWGSGCRGTAATGRLFFHLPVFGRHFLTISQHKCYKV
jgi:hypothetical protein